MGTLLFFSCLKLFETKLSIKNVKLETMVINNSRQHLHNTYYMINIVLSSSHILTNTILTTSALYGKYYKHLSFTEEKSSAQKLS